MSGGLHGVVLPEEHGRGTALRDLILFIFFTKIFVFLFIAFNAFMIAFLTPLVDI